MYESTDALNNDQKEAAVYVNGEEISSFDSNGDVTIEMDWNDVTDLTVIHNNDGMIEFSVEISAEDPTITIGDFTIHLTRTESFTMVCSYTDTVLVSTDADVTVSRFGTAGELGQEAGDDAWSNSFDLEVFSDDSFETHITVEQPISLGLPVYAKMSTLD